MARPKNADGQRTRQAILDAALDLFAQKGYFGTSLRDVASAVGVRESALYNYFESKEALFDALIFADEQVKGDRFAALADGPITDARAVLEQVAVAALESYLAPRNQRLFCILMSDGIRLARTGRINLYERLGHRRERLHDLMRRLIRDGWLRAADPQMLGLAFGAPLVVWRQLHAIAADLPMIRNPRAFARQHVDQFLQGAAAPSARPSPSSRRAGARTPQSATRRTRPVRQSL